MAEGDIRKQRVVSANIIANHALEISRHRQQGTGDARAWSNEGLSDATLAALTIHQKSLLASPQALAAWVAGRPSDFDPARDLEPLLKAAVKPSAATLPITILSSYLAGLPGVTPLQAQALASLLQMMLEVDRDANDLQALYATYAALGLPVHTAHLGLPQRSDAEFLALAQQLAPQFCASPFATDALTLRMLFRKMWNWGHRYTGERDRTTVANELLLEPEVQALVPRLRALPARKIAVIGHSFTMNVHWSSPSAFVPISAALLESVSPQLTIRLYQNGGMTPSGADCQAFIREALDWKPDYVLIALAGGGPNNDAALLAMVESFRKLSIRVAMFDSLCGKIATAIQTYFPTQVISSIASKTGMMVIPACAILDASPEQARFLSLDDIHMTESYHRVMAKLWLKSVADSAFR